MLNPPWRILPSNKPSTRCAVKSNDTRQHCQSRSDIDSGDSFDEDKKKIKDKKNGQGANGKSVMNVNNGGGRGRGQGRGGRGGRGAGRLGPYNRKANNRLTISNKTTTWELSCLWQARSLGTCLLVSARRCRTWRRSAELQRGPRSIPAAAAASQQQPTPRVEPRSRHDEQWLGESRRTSLYGTARWRRSAHRWCCPEQ